MSNLDFPDVLTVLVAQDDIDHGIPGDIDNCPIALSVSKKFPHYTVSMGGEGELIIFDGERYIHRYESLMARDFVDAFDNQQDVTPTYLYFRLSI